MLKNKVEELVDKYLDEVISIRRYLHQNPELSLKEFNTAEFIVKELNKIGLDAQRGRENNGVVSNLNLGKGKKTLMLRADMDALPIQEETNFEFKSKNPGVMHACGHDVHTSILLGVSKVLNEIKDEFIPKEHDERKEFYLDIRKSFNENLFNFDFENYSSDFIERAAQIIFMNKTCFNGLFRVNKKGEFNVPFGKYKNPKIFDADNLMAASFALKNTKIVQGSFLESEKLIDENSLVYLDPPYRPLSKSSSFTSYSKFDFNDDDQIELAEYYKRISKIGAKAILSNSDPKNTDENDNFFDDLYCDFTIDRIQAPRMISCNGNERKPVNEILVRNF